MTFEMMDKVLRVVQVKAANNDDGTGNTTAASLLLDRLCEFYHTKQAKYTDSQRYEKLRYDMLIAAIDGALPMHSSAMVRLQPHRQTNKSLHDSAPFLNSFCLLLLSCITWESVGSTS